MLSFSLSEDFIDSYRNVEPDWGYGTLSEFVFIRTYSRAKEGGGKERWYEVCQRVIEGMYSIQKDWSKYNILPWDEEKAQRSAEEAFDRMFRFKWTPSGRGLWAMGTPLVNERNDSSSLFNCFFISTEKLRENFTEPFTFLMDASMMGGGVGFDTKGAGTFDILSPDTSGEHDFTYTVPDSREGWVTSVRLLLEAYAFQGTVPSYDYSEIRAKGEPIKSFGGVAPGPEPLKLLHKRLKNLLDSYIGKTVDSRLIIDIFNMIGVAVVSGNVRRSAEIAFGEYDDESFWTIKNYEDPDNSYRSEWGWMSNNSILVYDDTEPDYHKIVDRMATAGEPGIYWIDNARDYGRMVDEPDYKDWRVQGANPCGEIALESYEACNLSETYLTNHDSIEDFNRTLKFAYLYNKTVTLMSTHWARTNAAQLRNRRIGCSITGTAKFADTNGYDKLTEWLNEGYSTVRDYDKIYSEWLCVRESIKVTTSKPSGTVSLLAGVTSGVHWPTSTSYIRRVTLPNDSPLLAPMRESGYKIETSYYSPDTSVVVEIPQHIKGVRPESEVSVSEKLSLVSLLQTYWADNMVSNTINFDPSTEREELAEAIESNAGVLKSMSALPRMTGSTVYKQMPEEPVDPSDLPDLLPVDFSSIYDNIVVSEDSSMEMGCDNDSCII